MDLGFAWGRAKRWTPVLCLLLSAPADATECWYAPKSAGASGPPELAAQGNCGEFAGPDEFRISRSHLGRLRFQDGLAEVRVENKAFYDRGK